MEITETSIRALRNEAASVGDTKLVATCDRALNGSARARKIAAGLWAYAQAENKRADDERADREAARVAAQ